MEHNDSYEKLLSIDGLGKTVGKWNMLSDNLRTYPKGNMVLPDMLWVTDSGVGKTHLLRLLSEYLASKGNLMEFCGDTKYFEFMLDYCPPTQHFGEVQRLMNEISNASGYRSVYKGILSVDVDEWVGHCEEKNFLSFLEYLSENSDDWLVVFCVTDKKGESFAGLEAVLSTYFRFERVELRLPPTEELVEFVANRLRGYDLLLEDDAAELLKETITRLRRNKYFDGYKTLVMLSLDIVYETYSAKAGAKSVTAADLKEFSVDSKYVARTEWKAEMKRKIGLLEV